MYLQASGGSDVAEEYDTDHDSSSSDDDDEEGEDGKKRKKIRTKTIAEPGKQFRALFFGDNCAPVIIIVF